MPAKKSELQAYIDRTTEWLKDAIENFGAHMQTKGRADAERAAFPVFGAWPSELDHEGRPNAQYRTSHAEFVASFSPGDRKKLSDAGEAWLAAVTNAEAGRRNMSQGIQYLVDAAIEEGRRLERRDARARNKAKAAAPANKK